MKKALFFLVAIATISSCKRQNDLQPSKNNTPTSSGKLKTLSGGDGKWDVLGYGLNITGNLLDISSISDAPIINVDKLAADYLTRINVNNTTEGTTEYFSGATALDYLNDVTKSKTVGISGNYGFGGTDKNNPTYGFTGSLNKNTSDQTQTAFSSKYSYATYQDVVRVRRIQMTEDITTSMLLNYLTPEFTSNIATMSADALVARYGTHVMLDISIGGRLRFDYSGSILSETDYTKKTSDTKAAIGFSLAKLIGVNINTDKSTTEINQIVSATSDKQYIAKYYGGTNSGRTVSIDKDGNSSESINLGAWEQSVNVNNAALINVGKAIFLYDLIADPTKKAQVKTAVEKYISDRQIKLAPVPVYSFLNSIKIDHFYTIDNKNYGDWKFEGTAFYAYPSVLTGFVPVYRYLNSKVNDHFYATEYQDFGDWKYEGIAFYASTAPAPGLIPIYRYLNSKKPDHYYSTEHKDFGDWKYERIAFYVPQAIQ